MTGLAALLAAVAVGLWRGRPARARDRLSAAHTAGVAPSRRRRRSGDELGPADPIALALAVDLIAACLDAGVPLPAALDAGSMVAGEATAGALASMAAALRRGAAAGAWPLGEGDQRLAAVVRICARVATTGASVAEDLRRLAAQLRRAHQSERRQRAQRASVWVVLPLGLCFLPAFLLLTVVPVVVALLPALR